MPGDVSEPLCNRNTDCIFSNGSTFGQNDPDFQKILKEHTESSVTFMMSINEKTPSANLDAMFDITQAQGRLLDRSQKNRMLSGMNAWTSLLPSQSSSAILSSYMALLRV